MDGAEALSCPFGCGFTVSENETLFPDHRELYLMQHIELIHAENGESPFVVKETSTSPKLSAARDEGRDSPEREREATKRLEKNLPSKKPKESGYIECPYHCGELVSSTELSSHTDFHLAEEMALDEAGVPTEVQLSTGPCNDAQALEDISNHFTHDLPEPLRNRDQFRPSTPSRSDGRRRISLKEMLFGSPGSPRGQTPTKSPAINDGRIRRLGRAELGPYAHERQMPGWLRRMLEEGAKVTIINQIGPYGTVVRVEAIANETPNLVPVLARLSDLDSSVERAFYCSPAVRHIAKMPREGGFCGYRNIQMMISYVRDAQAPGCEHFQGKLPSILRLQDLIENAWEMGFNSAGKIETGGIRLTRKYIGTPEAQALFLSLSMACEASAFARYGGLIAHESHLLAVGEYFSDDKFLESDDKVQVTAKPPIYFQHQGHSMTIVGLEVRKSGAINLVVFDPMFNPSPAIKKLVGSNSFRVSSPERLLKAHRRGESYLGRYRDFEILKLSSSSPKAGRGH